MLISETKTKWTHNILSDVTSHNHLEQLQLCLDGKERSFTRMSSTVEAARMSKEESATKDMSVGCVVIMIWYIDCLNIDDTTIRDES